jgi:phage-related minor tail protein
VANEVKIVVKGDNRARKPMQDATKDVKDLAEQVKKVPDKKVIKVEAKDDATAVVDKVDKKKVADKNVKVSADDQASATIDKVSKQKPPDVTVKVKADSDGVASAFGDAGKQGASAFMGGFTGGLAGGGLVDAASNLISDAFTKAGEEKLIAADIQNMMGVTPDQAKQYGDRIGRMFWDGMGSSKDQIASAFGNLSSDVKGWGDLTVQQQDRVVQGAVKISSAFKVDVVEPIKAASAAVNSGLVPSYEDAFDIITTGYQTLGSRADDFLETLGEYSPHFKELGFSGQQALGLISQGLQAGARDTDYIADVWKEVGIRIIDTAQPIKDALKDLGFKNIAKLQDEIAAGGPKAAENIEKVVTALQKIKDPTEKNRLGVALFGTQFEDTFGSIIDKTDLAKAKMTEFKGATEEMATGAITSADQLGRKWDEMAGNLAESFSTMVLNQESFQNTMNDSIFSMLGFGGEADKVTDHLGGLGFGIDGVNATVIGLAESLGGPATAAFGKMMLSMSETDLKAMGVKHTMDTLEGRVLTLPDGHKIVIDTNTGAVSGDIDALKRRVDNLPRGPIFLDYYINTIVKGPTPGGMSAATPWSRAAGGPVAGFGAASGGARGAVTRVNERGPELGRSPNGTIRDLESGTTVIPAGQSAAVMSGAGPVGLGGGGGVHVTFDVTGMGNQIERLFGELLKRMVRTSGKGGNLGKVFGGQ